MTSEITRTSHHRTSPAQQSSSPRPIASSSTSNGNERRATMVKSNRIATESSSTQRIKRDPEVAIKQELDKKNQIIRLLTNGHVDANEILNDQKLSAEEKIKRLIPILNLETLSTPLTPKSQPKSANKSNINKIPIDLRVQELDKQLQELNGTTEDLYSKIQKNEMPKESIQSSLDRITSVFDALLKQKEKLMIPIACKIAKIDSKIAKDTKQIINEQSIPDIINYSRTTTTAKVKEEIDRRREITLRRISQKDLLTAHSKSLDFTEKLLLWNIQKIYLGSLLIKQLEDTQIKLQCLSKSKHHIIEDFKPGTDSYKGAQDEIVTSAAAIVKSYTELFLEAQNWLKDHQAHHDKVKASKDYIQDELSQITIADDNLRERISKQVARSLESIIAERETALNDIKAMIIRVSMAYEETKWNVQSLQTFGELLASIEKLTGEILKLESEMFNAKEEHRNAYRSGNNYRDKKFIDQFNLFLQTYNDLASQTRALHLSKIAEIGAINKLIAEKSDPSKAHSILASHGITDDNLAATVAKDISDNLTRMIATLNSIKNKVEANWKSVYEKMHSTSKFSLPLAIDRMNYVLSTDGLGSIITRDVYPLEANRGITWFPVKMVTSPFEEQLPNPVAGPSSSSN